MIDLNLLQYQSQLDIKNENGKRWIKCIIRQKYLVLTPEELVRQLLILYLTIEKQYSIKRIAVEKGLTLNGLLKRWDILIYNKDFTPYFLIECKAPSVPITQSTLDQIARYNLSLKVPLLLVTNGQVTYCYHINFEQSTYMMLDTIPIANLA